MFHRIFKDNSSLDFLHVRGIKQDEPVLRVYPIFI